MKIFKTKQDLRDFLDSHVASLRVSMVPTMGALHEGHLSLIEEAKRMADIVVCSIFVNPTQFNDPADLEKYPRPIATDIALLQQVECDVLFLPEVAEIYPDPEEKWSIDLGTLDSIWEGEHRPGHFQGVTQVVYRLFQIVQPDIACFGQKDFQQVMVIQRMLDITELPVKLQVCPTVRNAEGLALSSRNVRLSAEGRHKALVLSRALQVVKQDFGNRSMDELRALGKGIIAHEFGVELEYFALCETRSLEESNEVIDGKQYVALVAAWVEGVRLIDNMLMNV